MTQEDKELLLKDLSARLPYGVICRITNRDSNYKLVEIDYTYADSSLSFLSCILPYSGYQTSVVDVELNAVKPYLRSMSSMTEEEWKELNCIGYIVPLYNGCFGVDMRAYCKNGQPHYRRFSEFSAIEDWLNAHHFDYRGLIEKGLAIAVTEENNPYKE